MSSEWISGDAEVSGLNFTRVSGARRRCRTELIPFFASLNGINSFDRLRRLPPDPDRMLLPPLTPQGDVHYTVAGPMLRRVCQPAPGDHRSEPVVPMKPLDVSRFHQDEEFSKLLVGRRDVDLVVAALEIARDAHPDLAFSPTLDWIQQRADQLTLRLAGSPSEHDLLEQLVQCLSGEFGLCGDDDCFNRPESRTVGVEFVGTSITSGGDGLELPIAETNFKKENPHLHYFLAKRGYVSCSVDAKEWRSDYRIVPIVTKPGAGIETRAKFRVAAGTNQVERA